MLEVINLLQTTYLDPGTVSVRVAFVLRSTEVIPAFSDLFPLLLLGPPRLCWRLPVPLSLIPVPLPDIYRFALSLSSFAPGGVQIKKRFFQISNTSPAGDPNFLLKSFALPGVPIKSSLPLPPGGAQIFKKMIFPNL